MGEQQTEARTSRQSDEGVRLKMKMWCRVAQTLDILYTFTLCYMHIWKISKFLIISYCKTNDNEHERESLKSNLPCHNCNLLKDNRQSYIVHTVQV